jgi:hypothetical protein
MIKAWADAWVKALRSGEYKQTEGRLHRPEAITTSGCGDDDCCAPKISSEGFCCLGVLTDIVIKALPIGEWDGEGNFDTPDKDDFASSYTPEGVVEVVGLKSGGNPYLYTKTLDDGSEKKVTAAVANDEHGLTFEQIADHIEQNYADM